MALDFPSGQLGGIKFANFSMSNGSIHQNGASATGISSITRNTTATYTVNFSGEMSSEKYAVTAMGQYEWSFGGKNQSSDDFQAGSCAIRHGRYGTGVGGEISHATVMIYGHA